MTRETLHFPCDVHDAPDAALAARIILLIRKHGRGGVRVCLACGRRARASLGPPPRAEDKESA
jgi:hypothetical protein